ncbi:MAG TPA: hypothetical protein VIG79_13875 [Lapillicoccus sp.]|jgi:hypothetical protein|uniref:DUF7144 family membrane protein n=1 Tax=Lapillicoccus sp. TaxID=1909287 RepID=UPI002F959943
MSPTSESREIVAGWGTTFAGVMMMIVGLVEFFQGLVAVINGNQFFVTTPNYVFQLNLTTWGWIHLVLGAVIAVAGLFIFTGNIVARSLGMLLAGLQALANFVWLPYSPLWSIVIIAIDVFIIWSLATLRMDHPF